MKKFEFVVIAAALAVLVFTSVGSGQEFRGSILGQVLDSSNSAVPGAKIVVINEETNTTVELSSNEVGNYNAPFLQPGTYTLTAEAGGFKKMVRKGIVVQVQDRITLNLVLELGQMAETISVVAEAPALQTASADLGQVVERHFLDRLPVSGQSVMTLADMAPGVLGGGGAGYTSNAQNEMAINGGSGQDKGNDVSVDGIPNVAARQRGLAVTIPMADAVQEFKVQTTMFDAASGRSNAGTLAITTRSGSNVFHGSGHYYLQNRALNANSWENNRRGLPKPESDYNLWGGTFGGPVRLPKYNGKDRTFFFFGYERTFNQRPMTGLARIPTEAERTGDFSQTLAPRGAPLAIYDPATTILNPNGGFVSRQAFPGARIPASRISPIGAAVLGVYPTPNQNIHAQIGVQNWGNSASWTTVTKNVQLRVDQNIGSNQRLYARFSDVRHDQGPTPNFFEGAYSVPPNGQSNIGFDERRNKSFALDDTVTFTPTLVNSFRYGYTRTHLYAYRDGDGRDPSVFKLPDAILRNQTGGGWPIFDLLNENMAIIGSRPRKSVNDIHALQSTANYFRGAHNFRAGVDYRLLRWNESNPGTFANGEFVFNNTLTRSSSSSSSTGQTSGTAMASLLLGLPANNARNRIGYTSDLALQNHYTWLFFQDDFKVNRKLTLNLGLRWEIESPFTERFDRIAYGFDPDGEVGVTVPGVPALRGGVLFVNQDGLPRRQGNQDMNNFGPRFGWAWSMNDNTVLRGGYGIFFSSGAVNISAGTPQTVASFSAVTPYVGSTNSDYSVLPGVSLSNPFPDGIIRPTGNSLRLRTELGNRIALPNDNRALPYVQQWQISVQRQLPWQTLAEAAYVGSQSIGLFEDFTLTELPDQYFNATDVPRTVPNPFLGIFPASSVLGKGATIRANKLRVNFPQFDQVTASDRNSGRAVYHSLQTRAQKRLSHGLSLVANYTWSKVLLYQATSVVNERHYRTVADIDRRHMLRAFATYDLPWGRNRSFGRGWSSWLDSAAGGWSLTWTSRYVSGAPLGLTEDRGRPIPVSDPNLGGSVHDRLGDRIDPATHLPVNPYFDTSAFIRLADDYTITPEPALYDWLRGPGNLEHNLTVFKTFSFRERAQMELRAEINQPFNTPVFAAPETDMSTPGTFGVINATNGARRFQIGAKVRF